MALPASNENQKSGVLLVNLGSPDSTEVEDVRRYLRQFLMDGRVLDAPTPIRWFIVNCLILPKRPERIRRGLRSRSGPEEGSPLIVTSKRRSGSSPGEGRREFPDGTGYALPEPIDRTRNHSN